MSSPKKRKNVPRIVRKLKNAGVSLTEAKKNEVILDNCIDVEYHWDTLATEEALCLKNIK